MRPPTPLTLWLLIICASLASSLPATGHTAPSDAPNEPARDTSEDTPTGSDDSTADEQPTDDTNADADSSEDTAPAADPDRLQARRRAQAGMMTGNDDYLVQEWTLDVALEGGFGGARNSSIWMGRAQVGPMFISEPHALSLLAVGEFQTDTQFAAGGMFQYLSVHTGLFWQAGATVDLEGRPGLITSAGWQIIGFEYQRRRIGGAEYNAFLGKLRIPATWLYRAFSRKPAHK
jgi:hypothetical protein